MAVFLLCHSYNLPPPSKLCTWFYISSGPCKPSVSLQQCLFSAIMSSCWQAGCSTALHCSSCCLKQQHCSLSLPCLSIPQACLCNISLLSPASLSSVLACWRDNCWLWQARHHLLCTALGMAHAGSGGRLWLLPQVGCSLCLSTI